MSRRACLWWTVWCGAATLHAWSLKHFPAPAVDEAWNANRAVAYLRDGVAYGTLDAGVFDRFPGYWTYLPVIPTALHALAIRLAGETTLLALRIETLAFGAVLLAACYRIGAHAGGRALGLLGALLTSLSAFFLLSAHLARWDVMVAAAGYWSLALLLTNARRRSLQAALAGLLIGLGFEVHPHAAVFVLPCIAIFAAQSSFRVISRPDVWAWVGGGAVGGVVYVVLHVLPYPVTFASIARVAHGPTHTPPLFTMDPGVITASVRDTAVMLAWDPAWCAAWLIALLFHLRQRSSAGDLLGCLAGALATSAVLLFRNKFSYYGIYVGPALDLALAAFLLPFARQRESRIFAARTAAIVALGIGFTARVNLLGQAQGLRSLQTAVATLAPHLSPDDVIMGPQTYWLGMQQHRYLSWEQLIYYRRLESTASLEDALRALRADVLIVDDHLRSFLRDDREGPYGGFLNISRHEMNSVLSRHAQEVAVTRVPSYGLIRLYRFEWSGRRAVPADRARGRVRSED